MSGEKAEKKSKEKAARVLDFSTDDLYKLISKGRVRIILNGEIVQLELPDADDMNESDAENIESAYAELGDLVDELNELFDDDDESSTDQSEFDDDSEEDLDSQEPEPTTKEE